MKFKNMLFPKMVCPAWIPELNSVEHGPEGKEGFALSPRKAGKLGMGPLGGVAGARRASPLAALPPASPGAGLRGEQGRPSLPSSTEHLWQTARGRGGL